MSARPGRWSKRQGTGAVVLLLLAAGGVAATAGMIFDGDGSDEPGFVPPPVRPKAPPPPPANIAGGESYIPYPGPPVVPQSRSEKKRPPSPPVMFTKLTSPYGPIDWAARPNDLNNLLKSLKRMADVDFGCEAKSFAEIDPNPERNPILYRTGHFHFFLSEEERRKLRQYLLAGGMIILNPGMGSKPFYDSARRELAAVFPEAPLRRLGADHPIFHAYYELDRVGYRKAVRDAGYRSDEPWLEGVTIDCRTVAVVSRWGLEIGWDPLEDESLLGYASDSAQKLGMNLLAYATAQRAWAKQAAHALQFVDPPGAAGGSRVQVAQVIYDGEWKTRQTGLSVLLQQFNRKTEIPVQFARQELRLSDRAIFDVPVLYLTGHEDFRLSAAEAGNLRQFLQNGGLLFAEACCGRQGFDRGLRRAIAQALPGRSLQALPPEHALFALPQRLTRLAVTPALAASAGNRSTLEPQILGLELDGRLAVIYSPYGLAGGWELAQNPYAFGYEDSAALALGQNILMYALLP